MNEKRSIPYKKLVVPTTMRSMYWQCYGFPANEDGEILTKMRIVCILCKSVITYNRNTSNLRMHLQNKHFKYLLQLQENSPKPPENEAKKTPERKRRKKTTSEKLMLSVDHEGEVFIDTSMSNCETEGTTVQDVDVNRDSVGMVIDGIDTPLDDVAYLLDDGLENDVMKNKASCAVTDFIIVDLQLPDIVESEGFQRLIASLQSPCLIPSKSKLIQEILPCLYRTHKDALIDTLSSSCSFCSLAVEEWQSDFGETFLTFSVFFLHKIPEEFLRGRVLSTVHNSLLSDFKKCSATIEDMLQEFCIKPEQVKVFVCATDEIVLNSYLMDRGYTVVPCLLSTFQRILTNGCFSTPCVSEILVKTRTLLDYILKDSNFLGALKLQDQLLQMDDETPLTVDFPKVWLSTYSMLEGILKRRSIIEKISESSKFSSQGKQLFILTDDDWSIISNIVKILEPFKVISSTLAEEKSPLLSIVKPLLNELFTARLETASNESNFSITLKNTISTMLKDTFCEESIDILLKISSSLDPRMKSLFNGETKDLFNGRIKEELIISIEDNDSLIREPIEKKPKLSGMELLLRNVCVKNQCLSSADKADIELTQYENEPTAGLEVCPLAWWQCSSSKYPNLSVVASTYNSIPATVLPKSWIPMEKHVNFHVKRSQLPVEVIDIILFLHSSYSD